ncbi:MAG: hypothetical protein MZW92_63155 [Comamonadaceae bacterium]|nr:hypothetical protein [Comamonadaceae bacterium]
MVASSVFQSFCAVDCSWETARRTTAAACHGRRAAGSLHVPRPAAPGAPPLLPRSGRPASAAHTAVVHDRWRALAVQEFGQVACIQRCLSRSTGRVPE